MTLVELVRAVSLQSLLIIARVYRSLRILAWGFLASQEVKDAEVGNIGLQDRMCLCPAPLC